MWDTKYSGGIINLLPSWNLRRNFDFFLWNWKMVILYTGTFYGFKYLQVILHLSIYTLIITTHQPYYGSLGVTPLEKCQWRGKKGGKYHLDQRISVFIISEIDPGISKSIQVLRHADFRSEGNERKVIPVYVT